MISLAGLHSTATITHELSKGFKKDGMLAYVNTVQRREREMGVDVLTHQKWSGAGYLDGILGAIQSGSSGSRSMGEGNTEGSKFSPKPQPTNQEKKKANSASQPFRVTCSMCIYAFSKSAMRISLRVLIPSGKV